MAGSRIPLIVASGLGKRFGTRVAIDDVSLELQRGEVMALVGPNGAGKTTTLRLLAGLIVPTSGTVAIDGVQPNKTEWPAVRARIGFLTESPGLWDRLSVEANLLTYARLFAVADPHACVRGMLERFGLSPRASDAAGTLSKGMRQKVAIARALLHDPAIVLLDEPTAGLDPAMALGIRDLIGLLRHEGRGIVISTHNLDDVARLADRVAVLDTRLLALDAPEALAARWNHGTLGPSENHRVRIVVRSTEGLAEIARAAGALDVVPTRTSLECAFVDPDRDVPQVVRALVTAGADIQAVVPEAGTLEQAYLAITRRDAGPQ